jgi:apolipoprotein N-acyltransferase
MAKTKRRSRKEPRRTEGDPPPVTEPTRTPRSRVLRDYGLLVLGGVLMFLGFAGFGIWPLAFVGLTPVLFALDPVDAPAPTGRAFFARAFLFGFIAYAGGFYWIYEVIVVFGGFPVVLGVFFSCVFFAFSALQYVGMLWLWRRAVSRGWEPASSLVVAFLTAELLFPKLFDHYYGNSLHDVPLLIQVADLGGPMLVTALVIGGSGALYALVRSALEGRPLSPSSRALRPMAVFAVAVVAYAVYGQIRITQTMARAAEAPALRVGTTQIAMGIFESQRRRMERRRRYFELSYDLQQREELDLLLWPEGAGDLVRMGTNVRRYLFQTRDGRTIDTPVLFGGATQREVDGDVRLFNTALLADGDGLLVDSYDKTYLLAFGEFLPFGELFPYLYELSPHTSRFTPGSHVEPIELGEHRITVLVCYEDILPGFARRAVREGDPHLLVNLTNDAWFQKTVEPWIHLALAKFRAVEHRRYLVRSTVTGVSAFVDPAGRVIAQGPFWEQAAFAEEVRMMDGGTVYGVVGDWPGYVALGAMVYLGFVGRRRRRGEGGAA